MPGAVADSFEARLQANLLALEMRDAGFAPREIARAAFERFGVERSSACWTQWLCRQRAPRGLALDLCAAELHDDRGLPWWAVAREMRRRYGIDRHEATWRYRVERLREAA